MNSPTFSPLYVQIKGLLLEGLRAGEWRPGEPIPSEVELAQRFNVSQGTVRKAVDELAAQHLLVRRQGKGTFVATHGEARVRFRFLRLAPDEGATTPPERRLVDLRRARAGLEAARALDLKSGEQVVLMRRLLIFAGEPVVFEEISLPGGTFRGLNAAVVSGHRGSLYGLFESEFGIRMVRAGEKLKAVGAQGEAARLLGVADGYPLLQVERIAYTYENRPMEWRRGLYRTDAHHYRDELG